MHYNTLFSGNEINEKLQNYKIDLHKLIFGRCILDVALIAFLFMIYLETFKYINTDT